MNTHRAAILNRLDPKSARLLEQNGGVVKGYIPRATPGGGVELVPWNKAARISHLRSDGTETPLRWNPKVMIQNIPMPQWAYQKLVEGLPPEIRREARERYEVLVKRLLTEMQQIKKLYGKYVPPASIAEEIQAASWRFGDPTLLKRIENVEPSAVEVYASYLMMDVANRQKEKDKRKVATDWHGHYNA